MIVCLSSCSKNKEGKEEITSVGTITSTPDSRIDITDTIAQATSQKPLDQEIKEEELRDSTRFHADTAVTSIESQKIESTLFALVPNELSDRIKHHEIPSEAAVGIKAYPNAYVIKLNPKVSYAGKNFITLELASIHPPEQILEYYHEWKDNWFYVEGAGIYTFKKDEEKYFRETNTLQILPYNKDLYQEIDSLLPFRPQSLIRIYYETTK